MRTKNYILIVLVALTSALLSAQTIEANQYVIWGIGDDQINIPAGSVITEAVLTIENVAPQYTPLSIHLLDNTEKGLQVGTDAGTGDYFDSYGVSLSGVYENGNYVCRLSQNDSLSPMRSIFPSPASVTLADSTTVQLSSAVLELMDYAGNGRGLGIGIDNGNTAVSYQSISLNITLKVYQGQASSQMLAFAFPQASINSLLGSEKPDFNGDGKSDILWRNATGSYLVQLVDGVNTIGRGMVGGDLALDVLGFGDFNNDNKTDILWRNAATGSCLVQLMDGVNTIGRGMIGGDLTWNAVGVVDFNGDGKSDILWRKNTTGSCLVQLMDGVNTLGRGTIGGDLTWDAIVLYSLRQ
jgi:hypothetical protein